MQIFRVPLKVLNFLQNFENLQRFFTGDTLAVAAMDMASTWGFQG
jgi:hypothetical protein